MHNVCFQVSRFMNLSSVSFTCNMEQLTQKNFWASLALGIDALFISASL